MWVRNRRQQPLPYAPHQENPRPKPSFETVHSAVEHGAIAGGAIQLLVTIAYVAIISITTDEIETPAWTVVFPVLLNPWGLLLGAVLAAKPPAGSGLYLGILWVLIAQGVLYGVAWNVARLYSVERLTARILVAAHLVAATAAFVLTWMMM